MKKKQLLLKALLTSFLLLLIYTNVKSLDLDSLEVKTVSMKSNLQKVDNLILLGDQLIFINKDKALKYNLQALRLSEQLNYKFDKKKLLCNIARVYIAINQDSATFYVNQSLALALKDNDEYILAENYNIQGNIQDQLSNRRTALLSYQKAEIYAIKANNLQLLPNLYNNMGIALAYTSLPEAIFYFNKAIEYSKKKGFENVHLRSILNKGITFKAIGNLDSALVYLDKAEILNKTVNNNYLLTTIYLNLSSAYQEIGNLNLMKDYALKGLNLSKKINYRYGIDHNYSNFQSVELKLGNYEKALYYGDLLLYKTNLHDRIDHIVSTYERQSMAYRALGRAKQALLYQDTVLIYKDSIYKLEKKQSIEELQKKYQLGKMEAAQTAQAKELKQEKQISFAALVLLVLISLGAIRYYRISKIKTILSKKLQQQTKELEALDKAKTHFFTNISHELKTPLTLILNPTKILLQKENINKEEQFLLLTIEKHSKQLLNLTNQILDFTKFDSNMITLNLTELKPHEVIQNMAIEFEQLAKSRQINYNINNQISKKTIIKIDKYKLETILKNLISNAIKFTPEMGFIQINAIEKADTLELIVSDSGNGILDIELSKIFDRYYQSNNSNISEGGTGIGLAICKEYTNALGGSIKVNSIVNQGSTFTVVLPKNEVKTTITTRINRDNIPSNLPLILIAEDNLDLQAYLKHILGQKYQLQVVNHGRDAITFLEQNQRPQLIISDVMMPVLNGYEFLEYCKNNPTFATIPFIMLTAVSTMKEKLKFLRLGIDDYILKPFVDEELIVRIDNLLENATQRINFKSDEIRKKPLNTPVDKTIVLTKEHQAWLMKVETIVKDKCQRFDFSVDTLAYDISLSRSQTHRKIKTLTGLTPKAYINNVRFEMARKLLNSAEPLTIKAISLSVGFKDEKYFSRKFKQHFGKNPSEYL